MKTELDKALQQSFVEGAQMTLAEMNEEDYVMLDTFTGEPITYGCQFLLFRGRVFANYDNWVKWLILNSEAQLFTIWLEEDGSYKEAWDKHKKTRAKCLTREEK